MPMTLLGALKPYTLVALALATAAFAASDPEPAPIVERRLDYYDFTLRGLGGGQVNLRDYAKDKRVVIVAYVAGWCDNSNQNGHVVKRLYDKYKDRGLGLVAVAEYSTAEEVRMHANRVGADYPVAVETESRGARKKSAHYKYRQQVGDRRKWGTPFYVIIERGEITPGAANEPLARRVYTVSGEIIEPEADRFLGERLGGGN
jgi:glutathione peroxidase-family protein